jgi:hypothetical protein
MMAETHGTDKSATPREPLTAEQIAAIRTLNGAPADFPLGAVVTWLYTGGGNGRGGYGFCVPVDGVVVGHERARVRIRVSKKSGEQVERCVSPARLHLKGRAR